MSVHQFLVSALLTEPASFKYDPSLERLFYDISEGEHIGDIEKIGSHDLKAQEIPGILLYIGNDGSYFGDPAPCTPDGEIFLTNAVGDDTGHVTAEELENLGLPFNKETDFPLTNKELEQIENTKRALGTMWDSDYTTLWNGMKYHCPTFPIRFDDPRWGGTKYPPKTEALKTAEDMVRKITHFARSKNGTVIIEEYSAGQFFVRLKLPLI